LPITADLPLFVALERDLFRQEGIRIEAIRFGDANQAMNALIARQIDGAIMIGYSTLLTIFEQDADTFRIVQSAAETEDHFTARILVPRMSTVNTIPELRGKSIGTYSGATQRLNLLLILSRFFEKPEEAVQIVQVDASLQLASLASNRFDALFTIDPQATTAIHTGVARSIADSPRARYIVNPFPTAATVFSTELIESRPDTAGKLLRAFEVATMWAIDNPREAMLIVASPRYTELSEEIALASGSYSWWSLGQERVDSVQALADVMADHKLLPRRVNAVAMFADRAALGRNR
jgi:NitT/TauT family transport system substrate-binding protein